MKIKILSSLGLAVSGMAMIIVLNSSSGGVMGLATSGCSCHGTKNTSTTITLTGIPATGYITGQTYACTLRVSNTTKTKAGFDLLVSAGTITSASSGTMVMGNELHHTTPGVAVSGVTEWTFNYVAPSSPSGITFSVAGNAVNDNNLDSGDQWNTASFTFTGSFPSSVNDIETDAIRVYPNPANEMLYIQSQNAVGAKTIINSVGQQLIHTTDEVINIQGLPAGQYFMLIESDGQKVLKTFTKK
jgi:hypothetical protein